MAGSLAISTMAPWAKGQSNDVHVGLGLVDPMDDVLARAQAGEREAFREIFRRHRADVARLVFRMVGRSADLEDLVQDVFLQVHKSLPEFRGQAKFSTWLHRVTVNVVLMARRSAKSRPTLVLDIPEDTGASDDARPDDVAEMRRRRVAFARALESLPEKKRIVFVLHELEGKTPQEIAAIVDAPVLTVRTRLFYARQDLLEIMQKDPVLAQITPEGGRDSESGARIRPRASHESKKEVAP